MCSNYIREENQLQFNAEFINNDKGIIYCWIYENDKSKPFIGRIEYCTEDMLRCIEYNTNNTKILAPSDIVVSSNFTILSKIFSSHDIEGYNYNKLVKNNTGYKFNCKDTIRENNLHFGDIIKITYKNHPYTLEYTTKINFICDDYISIDVPYENREAWLEDWFGVVTRYISGSYNELYDYHIYPEDVAKQDVTIEVLKPISYTTTKIDTDTGCDFLTAIKYIMDGQKIRNTTWSENRYLWYSAEHQAVFDATGKFVNIMKYANLDNWEIKE